MKYTYIQDDFVPTEEASVPVSDRGFRFGDGVFETIRVEYGKLYNIDFHLNRLSKGLNDIRITFNAANLRGVCRSLVKKNKIDRGFVKVYISRGVGSQGYLPTGGLPTLIIETVSGINEPEDWANLFISTQKAGVISTAKTLNSLNYTLALIEAKEKKCDNAILLNDKDKICETAGGNLFWFKRGVLYTPSIKLPLIPGSVRQKVLNLYKGEIEAGGYKLDALKGADELFMTNVNCLVLPIKEVYGDAKTPKFKFKSNEKALKIRKLILDDIKSTLG